MSNGSNTYNDALQRLTDTVEGIIGVLEKNSHLNSPSSVYLYKGPEDYSSDYSDITSSEEEIQKLKKEMVDNYKADIKLLQEEIKKANQEYTKLLKKTSKASKKAVKARMELDKKEEELKKIEQELIDQEQEFEYQFKYSKASLKREWANRSIEMEKRYQTEENWMRSQEFKREYDKRTKEREDASEMIANSGLGHTWFGQFAQSAIARRHRVDAIKNMNNYLQTGGAEAISKSIFGDGKAAKAAASALKSVGNAASKSAGKVEMIIAAVKIVSTIVKFAGKIIAEQLEYQRGNVDVLSERVQSDYDYQTETLSANATLAMAEMQAEGAVKLKEIEVLGKRITEGTSLVTKQYAKAHEVAAGYMFNGIMETAYDAAAASFEAAADIRKYWVHKEQGLVSLKAQRQTSGASVESTRMQTSASLYTSLENYKATQAAIANKRQRNEAEHLIYRHIATEIFGYKGSQMAEDNIKEAKSKVVSNQQTGDLNLFSEYDRVQGGMTVDDMFLYSARGDLDTQLDAQDVALERLTAERMGLATYMQQQAAASGQKMVARANLSAQIMEKKQDIATQRQEIITDAALAIKKAWLELAKNVESNLNKFDKTVNTAGINLGIVGSTNLKEYKRSMFDIAKSVGKAFGVEIEEIIGLQIDYAESTGRNIRFSKNDYLAAKGLGYLLDDNSLAMQYLSSLEIFTHGVEDSVETLGKSYDKVNKLGLNFKKYMKDVTKNMALAEKYNFKGGTEGLRQMSIWAQKTGFDMQSYASLIEKIQTSSFDQNLQLSGQFNVLDGYPMMNSDPLGMIFDAFVDPQSLAEKMHRMLKGIGKTNPTNGETVFSIEENMLIAQLAHLQGLSIENLKEQIIRQNKADEVVEEISKNNLQFSNEQIEYIKNTSFFDRKSKNWSIKVATKGEHGETIYESKAISELTSSDMANTLPGDRRDRMIGYLEKLITASESMKGAEIEKRTDLEMFSYDEYINNVTEKTKTAFDTYDTQRDEYVKNATTAMADATTAYQGFLAKWGAGNPLIDEEVKNIETIANNLESNIKKLAKEAEDAFNALKSKAAGFGVGQVSFDEVPIGDGSGGGGEREDVDNTMYSPNGRSVTITKYDNAFTEAVKTAMLDMFAPTQNKPMLLIGNDIQAIGPGQSTYGMGVVTSDPHDSAIFAKKGGKIDILFNEQYAKIDKISERYTRVAFNPAKRRNKTLYNEIRGVNVDINGLIDFDTNGESIDITQLINENPQILSIIISELGKQMTTSTY